MQTPKLPISHELSDQLACARMLNVKPEWQEIEAAAAALHLDGRVLLHAGPPIPDPAMLARPVLNSAVMAVLFEGWALTGNEAEEMILSSAIRLEPAQDHYCVVPLADVLSPSMFVQRVADRSHPQCVAFSPLNGGGGPIMRVGQRNDQVLEHLRWINGELAPALARALNAPISLLEIADAGLVGGDDCHGHTVVATRLLTERLAPMLRDDPAGQRCIDFLGSAPSFFLNLWMAATKCILRAAEGVPDASIVTAIGGNGIDFGIQLAGAPGRWFTTPATPPLVPAATPYIVERSLGAIGDSAVVDAFGLGAMAFRHSPQTAEALVSVLGHGADDLPTHLLMAVHPGFPCSRSRTVLPARAVAALQAAPVISLGVLDKQGLAGRLAGGMYQPPVSLFEVACNALGRSGDAS